VTGVDLPQPHSIVVAMSSAKPQIAAVAAASPQGPLALSITSGVSDVRGGRHRLRFARGEWLCTVHQNDMFISGHLSALRDALRYSPEAGLVRRWGRPQRPRGRRSCYNAPVWLWRRLCLALARISAVWRRPPSPCRRPDREVLPGLANHRSCPAKSGIEGRNTRALAQGDVGVGHIQLAHANLANR
jgi:hypothetical protein